MPGNRSRLARGALLLLLGVIVQRGLQALAQEGIGREFGTGALRR
jgi:hypothetical protein